MVAWAILSAYRPRVLSNNDLAYFNFVSSIVLTGITTIYCGITGFILLENRRMRMQAVLPRVQVVSHTKAPDNITIELENSGAGPAVEVSICAWIMEKVGQERTPSSLHYRGKRHSLPTNQAGTRVVLVADPSGTDFMRWQAEYLKAEVDVHTMDPKILLIVLDYKAVDGTSISDRTAVALVIQPTIPGGTS